MKNNTKKTLGYFWRAVSRHKLVAFLMFGFVASGYIIEIFFPIYFRDFFNLLASNGERNVIFEALISLLIAIAVLKLIQWLAWRGSTFTMSHLQTKVVAELSEQCFANLHKHSFSFFSNSFVGSLVKRVKWFTGSFETMNDAILWDLMPMGISIVAVSIVLFTLNPYLTLAVVVWSLVFLAINWVFSNYKLKYDIKRNEVESEVTGLLADTVTNNSNVKLFNGYGREVESFANKANDFRKIKRFTWNLANIFDAVQGFLMTVLEVGVLAYAVWLWKNGGLTLGDFVLIQAYLVQIFREVWGFGRTVRRIYEAMSDAEEMTQILELPHEINDIPKAKDLAVSNGAIEFRNVGFNYNETRTIFKKFNLEIKSREKLAVIGSSGSGKTTLIKLLLRMHDLTAGKILIDGQNIAKVTQESLWAAISLVPQDPILFHRSLMENIRYGKPGATDEEVVKAAKLAHCHEFISQAPEGYDTFVGERGIKLSGGERQRIAIARAILRNAPILVLDEATSSLDSESEHLIQDALDKLMKDKTVIVIAHRLSTIRQMDRIIVIDEGQIAEDGSHEDLTENKSGIYRKLWKLQAGGFIE